MGVAETEEALKVEVVRVRRTYCLQVWNAALNQAGVEDSSVLRRAESVYYSPAIRTRGSASSKADTSSEVVELGKGSLAKASPASNSLFEEPQQ